MTTIDIPALRAQADSGTVPAWHKDLLSSRLHRLDSGSEPVSPWREARERVRAQIKKNRAVSVATNPKQDALDATVRLPVDANMDQFMYRLR